METITVLRVEVSNSGNDNEGSLSSGKASTSSSLVGGALAGKIASGTLKYDRLSFGSELSNNVVESQRGTTDNIRTATREIALDGMKSSFHKRTLIEKKYGQDWGRSKQFLRNSKTYLRNINMPNIPTPSISQVSGVLTSGAAAYSLYGNYQQTGLNLSGSTHAASVQARKNSVATSAISIGVAALVNPALAAPMIAMKAYQLSQTNRKELFAIQKEQMRASVLQSNLVKNVAEKRF